MLRHIDLGRHVREHSHGVSKLFVDMGSSVGIQWIEVYAVVSQQGGCLAPGHLI